jgi:geranylgeranylglycerol-phosphate geranylgeranyltransferase
MVRFAAGESIGNCPKSNGRLTSSFTADFGDDTRERKTVGVTIAIVRLFRLPCVVPLALAFALSSYYACGGPPAGAWGALGLATGALALVLCGAFAIRDVAEVEYDRINEPDRPIPAGQVRPLSAGAIGAGLWAVGLVLAESRRAVPFNLAFLAVALVLLGGGVFGKRMGGLRPFLAGALPAVVCGLAVAFCDGARGGRAWTLPAFALWMLLSGWALELLKDIRTRKGDVEVRGRHNAIQRCPRAWLDVASWMILLGGAALVAPAFLGCRWVYRIGLVVPLAMAVKAALARRYESKPAWVIAEFYLVGLLALVDAAVYGF